MGRYIRFIASDDVGLEGVLGNKSPFGSMIFPLKCPFIYSRESPVAMFDSRRVCR